MLLKNNKSRWLPWVLFILMFVLLATIGDKLIFGLSLYSILSISLGFLGLFTIPWHKSEIVWWKTLIEKQMFFSFLSWH
jgi:uncharacterized membrane protein